MTKTIETKAQYTELMESIESGNKIDRETFDALTTFAKAKKIKKPAEDSVVDETSIVEVKETKAPKVKGPKAKCSVTSDEDSKMEAGETCDADARSNGMCAKHYSRLVYRAKPENAEKARIASANYAAKVREQKAAAAQVAEMTETAENENENENAV